MKYFTSLIALLLTMCVALADTYVTATPIGEQDNPYDLQEIISATVVDSQDYVYDHQPFISAPTVVGAQDCVYDQQPIVETSEVGAQDFVYDNQTVVPTVKVFEQNATVPIVEYSATYDPDTNQTTVNVSVVADPVPSYSVFVYDLYWNLLASYSTTDSNSSTTIEGEHHHLYVVVIANNIGLGGPFDVGIYPAFVVGTNIIPVMVETVGQYNITVYGGYAISPVYVSNTAEPIYVVAVAKVVEVSVSP